MPRNTGAVPRTKVAASRTVLNSADAQLDPPLAVGSSALSLATAYPPVV